MVLALWDKRHLHLRSWWYPSPKFNKLTPARYFITSPPTERGNTTKLSDKTKLLVQKYIRRQFPELEEVLSRYIGDELQRIEQLTTSLANASNQVSDNPPTSAISPKTNSSIGLAYTTFVTLALKGRWLARTGRQPDRFCLHEAAHALPAILAAIT